MRDEGSESRVRAAPSIQHENLRSLSADELLKHATEIHDRCASGAALADLDELPEEEQDDQLRQVYMWNRDALRFVVLGEALKRGDVGTMEDMLPFLAYRFSGGNNNKYCIEILELLQGIHKEWPDDVTNFVREHCWLVNFSGTPTGFCPVDQAQEHNIKDIKEGPSIDWKFLKKMHPAIPIISELSKHMEEEFRTYTRGLKHTVPKKDQDVKKLEETYSEAGIHKREPGRVLNKKKPDTAEDFLAKGAEGFYKVLDRWQGNRNYERRTDEDWEFRSANGSPAPSSESGASCSDAVELSLDREDEWM
ncbi:hypothetical protein BD626DRAFT_614228 [Schizophyllum amplum]|uniref:DUF6589 domain-containing protein n=1 Tax=Schizophyllum amplum TaxID=97359 RepID=A0A550BZJ5_9AGAR|nr:hypothetical protein BD626DRAFT_614228 [Auriculariopsis ampla]